MITYITAFIFYTLAMVGILMTGFIIYKKTFVSQRSDSKGVIKIVDSYMIAPKKTLLIVRIENEKFLIASDAATTTFLAKLSDETIENSSDAYIKEETLQKIIREMNAQGQGEPVRQQYTTEKQNELKSIQNNFMDLYKNSNNTKSDNINTNALKKISSKKDVIQKLLKELNDAKTQVRSKY